MDQELPRGNVLIAGPERLGVDAALDLALVRSEPVLCVGPRPAAAVARRVSRLVAPASAGEVNAWLARHPGPCTVIVDGARSLGGWVAAERTDQRLARFFDGLVAGPHRTVAVVEPLDPDALLDPCAQSAALLDRVQVLRFVVAGRLVGPGGAETTLLRAWWGLHQAEQLSAPAARLRNRSWVALAGLVFVLAGFLPVLTSMRRSFNGQGLVGAVHLSLPGSLWSNWWLAESLQRGEPAHHSAVIYWPTGAELLGIFGNLGAPVLALPFQWAVGFPSYWNLFVAAALGANGMAAAWLARVAGARRAGAALAGLSFALAPPVLDEVATADEAVFWAFPLPLAVGAGIRALDGERREALLAAAALVLACLVYWFHGLFAVFVVGAVALHRAWVLPARRVHVLAQVGRVAKASWAPLLVLALPLLATANRGELPGGGWLELPLAEVGTAAGRVAFARLADNSLPLHHLLGVPTNDAEWIPTMLVSVLLGMWAVLYRGRRLFWPLVTVVAWALALGPWLPPTVGLSQGWLPLPMALVDFAVPFAAQLQHPDRLSILGALAAAVTLGLLWQPILTSRALHERVGLGAMATVGVLLAPVLSGVVPLPTYDYDPPAWVVSLGSCGAVIHVPIGRSEAAALYQPLHGNPVTGGPGEVVAMADASRYRTTLESNPALAFFWRADRGRLDGDALAELRARGACYVVVHNQAMEELASDAEDWFSWMLVHVGDRIDAALGPPVVRLADTTVYRLPDAPAPGAEHQGGAEPQEDEEQGEGTEGGAI